ncbi:MAG: GNAT family N-acetyltransferase [bacterium]|nr:GNAT family N-acetyltransferase [bacterium]
MSIIIRACSDADVAGVVALIEDRIGEEDAPEAQLVLEEPSYDRTRWSVAVDDGRVVSTMGTYPMTARLGICEVPAAMVELVATDRAYEGQGLVRRQVDYHHADLARRGDLFEVMVGITYFYRKLGYEYALPVAPWQEIKPDEVPEMPAGWTVRSAGEADRETIMALQRSAQESAGFAVALSPQMWSFLLRSPVYEVLLAERDGAPGACGRVYMDDGDPFVMDLAGSDQEGIGAVIAALAAQVPGKTIANLTRPSTAVGLSDLGTLDVTGEAYYARIGDPVRWLNAVRPELSRRLAASPLSDAVGEGMISLYQSSIRFSYAGGTVGEFSAGPGEPAPISRGGSGIPPDLVTSLLVGPLGFSGLAERYPDVNVGRQGELMDALFPAQTVDVQSWVVP